MSWKGVSLANKLVTKLGDQLARGVLKPNSPSAEKTPFISEPIPPPSSRVPTSGKGLDLVVKEGNRTNGGRLEKDRGQRWVALRQDYGRHRPG